jgi:hypothetical protein
MKHYGWFLNTFSHANLGLPTSFKALNVFVAKHLQSLTSDMMSLMWKLWFELLNGMMLILSLCLWQTCFM